MSLALLILFAVGLLAALLPAPRSRRDWHRTIEACQESSWNAAIARHFAGPVEGDETRLCREVDEGDIEMQVIDIREGRRTA